MHYLASGPLLGVVGPPLRDFRDTEWPPPPPLRLEHPEHADLCLTVTGPSWHALVMVKATKTKNAHEFMAAIRAAAAGSVTAGAARERAIRRARERLQQAQADTAEIEAAQAARLALGEDPLHAKPAPMMIDGKSLLGTVGEHRTAAAHGPHPASPQRRQSPIPPVTPPNPTGLQDR